MFGALRTSGWISSDVSANGYLAHAAVGWALAASGEPAAAGSCSVATARGVWEVMKLGKKRQRAGRPHMWATGLCVLGLVATSCSSDRQQPQETRPIASPSPQRTHPGFTRIKGPPACGALVFIRRDDERAAVFKMEEGARRPERLTRFTTSGPSELAVAPDGTRIAFTRGRYQRELVVVASNGSRSQKVLSGGGSHSFAVWRPGTDELTVLQTRRSTIGEVLVLKADGELEAIASGWAPSWSPDGNRLAVTIPTGRSSVVGHIEILDTRDPDEPPLRLSDGPRDAYPTWAPDGSSVAFERRLRRGDYPEIFVIASSGSGTPRQVTQDGSTFNGAADAQWDPTGSVLTYISVSDITTRVESIKARDGSPRPSTGEALGKIGSWGPDWSPSGDLAFVQDGEIRIIRSNGGVDVIPRPPGVVDDQPTWAPC